MRPFPVPLHRLLPLTAAAALVACSPKEAPPAPPRSVLVDLAQPAEGTGARYRGEVRARHEIDLSFRVGGKLAARLVDAGAEVKAGQALARLDPTDLQLAAQAARAQVSAAESEASTAKADRERYADLLGKKFVSQAAFDAKDNALRNAQSRLEQARAQAAVSGNQAGYGTLSADQAGVITTVLAEAGQVVGAGQAVLRLARPEEKEVAIGVPEGRIAELKAAPTLQVRFWALPDVLVEGRLRELSPSADAQTRTYAARIRLLNPPPGIALGMSAEVDANPAASAAGGAVSVPLSAVVDQGQGSSVWVVRENKVERRPVQVRQFGAERAVLSQGLQAGESVVIAGTNRLTPGMAVTPQPALRPEQQR